MSNIFTIHRQPYGEVMNPVSADGVRFYDKNGDITEVRMIDGMVNIHVGGVTVSAEHLEDLMRPPSAPVGVAEAWQQGYRQGVQDERTSEENIGIAGFGAKVEPARINPYLAQQPAATLPDEDDSDLTVAYMAGRHDGRKEAQQPAAVDEDWRKKAAEWLEAKAVEQEAANQRWPKHAACYKEWRDRPGTLRHLAFQVLAAQQGGSDNG